MGPNETLFNPEEEADIRRALDELVSRGAVEVFRDPEGVERFEVKEVACHLETEEK